MKKESITAENSKIERQIRDFEHEQQLTEALEKFGRELDVKFIPSNRKIIDLQKDEARCWLSSTNKKGTQSLTLTYGVEGANVKGARLDVEPKERKAGCITQVILGEAGDKESVMSQVTHIITPKENTYYQRKFGSVLPQNTRVVEKVVATNLGRTSERFLVSDEGKILSWSWERIYSKQSEQSVVQSWKQLEVGVGFTDMPEETVSKRNNDAFKNKISHNSKLLIAGIGTLGEVIVPDVYPAEPVDRSVSVPAFVATSV